MDIKDHGNKDKIYVQYDIRSYFKELFTYVAKNIKGEKEAVVFFHNLKFDGHFIVDYMLRNGYPYDTYISDMGVWYSVTLDFGDYKIVFRDSLKILNFKLSEIAELFKMEEGKGETPLLEYKPKKVLKEWLVYLHLDVDILATALYKMYIDEKFTKYTSSSEALKRYKETIYNFRDQFPILEPEIDDFVRRAYKGGWTYVKESIQDKIITKLIDVYDINSMYPATMLNYELPFGYPDYKEGEPKYLKNKLYIMHVWLNVELKKNHLPTFQTKDTITAKTLGIRKTDYIKSTNEEYFEFYLTNYDLDLIKKHYKADIKYIDYYEFDSKKGMFDDYIKIYRELKENAKTPSEKQSAKIMLNGLYGKMGARITSTQKLTMLDEDGIICYKAGDEEAVKPVYIPVATFVTSISRYFIISNAQKNYDIFLYADTDSLHLINNGNIDLDIHESRFGAWKKENNRPIVKAKYLRPKLYIEINDEGEKDVKGAGMTDIIKDQVTIDNFKIGQEFKGKLQPKRIVGGVVLVPRPFTIKKGGLMF